MTDQQWQTLLAVINGNVVSPVPTGFIIDSPWLPAWAGISVLDYYTSDQLWLDANIKAIETFPDIIFLPGFWAEFGMCTEPSAFGAKCVWHENELPFAEKIIDDITHFDSITKPDPGKDGLAPFVLNRLKLAQPRMQGHGHTVRFAVSRGSLNIASFLMGTTEFLTAIKTDPEEAHRLLDVITDFVTDWLQIQKENFDPIDGILVLDDIVGFLGEQDFKDFAFEHLRRIFNCFDVSVKFFHNDAPGLVCAPYLPEIGINLFNFSSDHSIGEMKQLTNNRVALLGNIPPRDVLAVGSASDIGTAVRNSLSSLTDHTHIILSCGGGMPPNVPTENIQAFHSAAKRV